MFTSQDLAPELENEKGTAGALGSGGGGTGSGNGGESVATTTIKGRRVKDHRYTQQVSVLFLVLFMGFVCVGKLYLRRCHMAIINGSRYPFDYQFISL